MRIGIDCRMLNETGIGRYIRNIVEQLAVLDDKNEYVLFVLEKDLSTSGLPKRFQTVAANYRWHSFAEQLLFPLVLYKSKLDIFFAPNLNVPILYFKPFVLTIHDLTVLKVKTGRVTTLPYPFYYIKRLAVRLPLVYGMRFAKAVFVVSEYVKNDLQKVFRTNPKKIHITPNAISAKFKRVADPQVTAVVQKYGVSKPYLFYIGNAHPHKNLETLLIAFELLKKEPKHSDLTLVLGGKTDFFYTRLQSEWQNSPIFNELVFTGYVDDADLPALYSGAEAFVTATLHEGFGIQLLEAFACGTKVSCSNIAVFKEVGQAIPYYFDPNDPQNIADVIAECVSDQSNKRQEPGYRRAQDFSWNESAKIILHEISTCL